MAGVDVRLTNLSALRKAVTKLLAASSTTSGESLSNPPSGKCRVTNIYVDPRTGKLEVEWDNTPQP